MLLSEDFNRAAIEQALNFNFATPEEVRDAVNTDE
jgi:hypothetical protein